MAIWDIEIIFEPTGDSMNFQYETATLEEDDIYKEVANQLSVVPTLIDEDEEENNVIPFRRME
jgi:hypothetical protein